MAIPPLSNGNPSLEAVSTADPSLPKGVSAGGDSLALSLTADGVFMLFVSTANNLVTNDHNAPFTDIFLRNRTNGAVKLVSANAGATSGGNGNSGYASVTPDGRYVVFQSEASDLVTNDLNQVGDVFVRDMTAETTALVSLNRQGNGSGTGDSSSPVITPDGRFTLFDSRSDTFAFEDQVSPTTCSNGTP
ncbi:MAG: PD40 domain-containing protein [Chloroflexi bacterium]|nr:PD40 domain-containing protein [Chloroflexota bacterium]